MWSKYPEISHELNIVEELIRKNMPSRNKMLSEVVSELVSAGGKRLRPAFVIISSKFGNYDSKKISSVAGAIEIFHTATLVHDDIIDKAELRRGKVTVSQRYGVDMAVYTGDYLFAKAVLLLSESVPAQKLDMIAKAVKSICEGEVDQYRDRFKMDLSVLSYLKRINRKTALLFAASSGMGAYIAECPENTVKALTRFGMYYGMAFQIRDDMNDFLLDRAASGKPVVNDIATGVITLPVILAMKKDERIKKSIEKFMDKNEDGEKEDSNIIKDLIYGSGGMDEARRLLEKYIQRGLNILGRLPDNPYKSIFSELIKGLRV